MYRSIILTETSIERNTAVEGETIEMKVDRIMNNNEPLTDGAPLIYTDRSDGVRPEYNIRTDKFEVAMEAMDKASRNAPLKRKQYLQEIKDKEENARKLKEEGKSSETENNSGTSK